ncbi:MAG: hypothetical protein AAGE94_16235, partial [Acidobacteriota bacterium]
MKPRPKTVRRLSLLGLGAVTLSLLGACTGASDHSDDSRSDLASVVVAEHRHGRVTVHDLDRYLGDKATDWRWQGLADEPEWVRLIERVAVEQILDAEPIAEQRTADLERQTRDLRRRVAVSLVMADEPPPDPIRRADLEAYFETRREDLELDERRRVLHIFKRYD